MEIFRKISPNLLASSSLALGMFDGVHLGHQTVLADAIRKGEVLKTKSAVVAFANHPQLITCKTPTKLLTTLEDRLNLFEKAGIEAALILDFTKELAEMSAYNYLKKILIETLNAKSITIGYDHSFGAERKGDYNFLVENSPVFGYEIDLILPVSIDGKTVSSSLIRNFINIGEVDLAAKLLGRSYSIKGNVIEGKKRGKILGFPTANLKTTENIVIPGTGAYAGTVEIDKNKYKSVINIGKNPTFGDINYTSIEVHIFDFSDDIYGKAIRVNFIKKLRNEKKFSSIEDLISQIRVDCQNALHYL